MDRDGDLDGDGFYEYRARAEGGLANQGWKDSDQAILHPDGRLATGPIALSEVQALAFTAKRELAMAFEAIGEHGRAGRLREDAQALRRRFNERFWMPEAGTFALALDGNKEPVRSIGADAGLCLAHGIVEEDKAPLVARRLMAPDLFTGWGLRSLSSDHPCFNPFGYHLGTVWPFASATVACGLKRYGCVEESHRLSRALFEACRLFEHDRLPEVFGGHARSGRHPHPGMYPGGCAPQAWSASVPAQLVQALVGLRPAAWDHRLVLEPALPDWLPDLLLRDIRVGTARLSLQLRRDGAGHTQVEILDNRDGLAVEIRGG